MTLPRCRASIPLQCVKTRRLHNLTYSTPESLLPLCDRAHKSTQECDRALGFAWEEGYRVPVYLTAAASSDLMSSTERV